MLYKHSRRRYAGMYSIHESRLVKDASIADRIKDVLTRSLSPMEKEIIASFQQYFEKMGSLSTRQYDLLLAIQNRYSDENIKKSTSWIASFDDEKKERFKLAVKYYSTTGYFTDVVMRVTKDPDYIPTEKLYKSMCLNKYFENALKNYNSAPLYDIGDLVVFRKRSYDYDLHPDTIGMIANVSESKTFEKGQRSYSIMILGTEDSINVYERNIKLYREKKNVQNR